MNAIAPSAVYAPTSLEASRYQEILQGKIREGARRAAGVIEAIQADQPTDRIAPTKKITFDALPVQEGDERTAKMGITVVVDGEALRPTDYALGQVAEKASVPTAYLRELATSADGWKRGLAVEILTKHTTMGEASRVLVRSVRGQLRGWLSDRYRRLDSRPLVDALAAEAQALGAVPIDGVVTDTRVALKVLYPEVLQPIPGEFLVLGGEWSNSDYGNGTHSFRQFALRVACLNGMTRENVLREIHLGGRLHESIAFSEKTYRLDTAASVSALRDTVRGVLAPAGRAKFVESIQASHAKHMTAASLRASLKNVDKKTRDAAVQAFESEDIINLPAGQTAWRASNAVSWIARHTEDAEKKLDLERVAGAIG